MYLMTENYFREPFKMDMITMNNESIVVHDLVICLEFIKSNSKYKKYYIKNIKICQSFVLPV